MTWFGYCETPMPGFSPEQTDSITATWKKRKRDHEETVTLARPATFTPATFRVDRPEFDGCSHPLSLHPEGTDISFRPRCLPRKRRNVQSPYLALQHQHLHQPQQSTHLSPNVYASNIDPYSPPVSPRTLVPLRYPGQTQQVSASPSALRPCHICHRRPTTRQVLDAYADCDLCHERACFICLRQCDTVNCGGAFGLADSMHDPDVNRLNDYNAGEEALSRRKICSSCAVEDVTETGAEIVRCLDCVQGHDAWSPQTLPSGWALDDMRHEDMTG